jgi:hypothetical protein
MPGRPCRICSDAANMRLAAEMIELSRNLGDDD